MLDDNVKIETDIETNTDINTETDTEIEADVETEISTEDESKITEEESKVGTVKRHYKKIIVLSAVILSILVLILTEMLLCSVDVTIEVGESVSYSHIKDGFHSLFCSVDYDFESFDSSVISETEIPLKFLGFIKINSTLKVKDTAPPVVTARELYVSRGLFVEPSMFVGSITDMTETRVVFKDGAVNTETKGEYAVSLIATDSGNNSVEFNSRCTVVDTSQSLYFENGATLSNIEEKVLSLYPNLKDVSMDTVSTDGSIIIRSETDNALYILNAFVEDSDAPSATVRSFDLLIGESVGENEIVTNVVDNSDVTFEIEGDVDFNKSGEYVLKVTLTDKFENSSSYESVIRVHDINTSITVELGESIEAVSDKIFKDDFSRTHLRIDNYEAVSPPSTVGNATVNVKGEFGTISVEAKVIDTTKPILRLKNISRVTNFGFKLHEFVASCVDASPVKYDIRGTYSIDKAGDYKVTITATDTSGNSVSEEATLSVFVDSAPPVIFGTSDFVYIIGNKKLDLSENVYANDDVWGKVSVEIDSSGVDFSTPGTYKVVYTATDGSGNVAAKEVGVEVKYPTRECLDVKSILQKPYLPNGCEATSLAIALKYAGYAVDPVTLYKNYMPKAPYKQGDPWNYYIGDATEKGLGCFAPCVVKTGNDYLSDAGASVRVHNVSYSSFSEFTKYIDNGTPVIVWGLVKMCCNDRACWETTVDGKTVNWYASSHCLVLIGYTDSNYIFCDPLRGIVEYSKADTETSYKINYMQACVIK